MISEGTLQTNCGVNNRPFFLSKRVMNRATKFVKGTLCPQISGYLSVNVI